MRGHVCLQVRNPSVQPCAESRPLRCWLKSYSVNDIHAEPSPAAGGRRDVAFLGVHWLTARPPPHQRHWGGVPATHLEPPSVTPNGKILPPRRDSFEGGRSDATCSNRRATKSRRLILIADLHGLAKSTGQEIIPGFTVNGLYTSSLRATLSLLSFKERLGHYLSVRFSDLLRRHANQ